MFKGQNFKHVSVWRDSLGREHCPAQQICLPRDLRDVQLSVVQVWEEDRPQSMHTGGRVCLRRAGHVTTSL